jgi:hypothetical protein
MALTGCGSQATEAKGQEPVLVINDLKLSAGELQQEQALAAATSREPVAGGAGEEPEWLGRLIERELLVQEAQRLGLDRQPDFMHTIERFWKAALIKLLLNRKAQEIAAQVHVYEPEIEAQYRQLSQETAEPLSTLREEIRRTIRQRKEAEAMERWLGELRARARIVVDREALAALQP